MRLRSADELSFAPCSLETSRLFRGILVVRSSQEAHAALNPCITRHRLVSALSPCGLAGTESRRHSRRILDAERAYRARVGKQIPRASQRPAATRLYATAECPPPPRGISLR